MKGMILAAGLGERLRPATNTLPKPLFAIGKTTMIRNAIGLMTRYGIREIAINLYHLGHLIKADLLKKPPQGANLHFIEEKTLMGTAGGIKGAEGFLNYTEFVLVNSDVLTDFNLGKALAVHAKSRPMMTLVTRPNPDTANISVLEGNAEGKITKFINAVSPDHAPGGAPLMFTGVSVVSSRVFARIPAGKPMNLATEVLAPMVAEGLDVRYVGHEGYWLDIGTPQNYEQAKADVKAGRFKPYE